MKKIKCILFGHKWNMYSGFYPKERIHHTAFCLRCGKKYKET